MEDSPWIVLFNGLSATPEADDRFSSTAKIAADVAVITTNPCEPNFLFMNKSRPTVIRRRGAATAAKRPDHSSPKHH